MFNKFKKLIINVLYNHIKKLNLSQMELDLKNLDKVKENNFNKIQKKFIKFNEMNKKYSSNPIFCEQFSIYNQNYNSDANVGFKNFLNFEEVKKKWLTNNNLNNMSEGFIPIQQVTGCLGNHWPLFYYLIYKELIQKNNNSSNLLLHDSSKITNPPLFKYFNPRINVIKSSKLYDKLNFLYEINKIPMEFTLPYEGKHYPWFASINFINQKLKNEKDPTKYFSN